MPACHLKPADKKKYISDVGHELVRRHGKQKTYSPQQVRSASDFLNFAPDFSCWAMSFYSSPSDFKTHHDAAGEVCDYAAMKAEVLSDLGSGTSTNLFDLDLSWLEWPAFDLSSVFDWFDIP